MTKLRAQIQSMGGYLDQVTLDSCEINSPVSLGIDTHEGMAGRFSVSNNVDYDHVARVDGNNFPLGQWDEW